MSYAINQQELPIREDVIITVFTHGVVSSFILSKEGTMLSSKNSIATEFRNRYRHHQLISGGNQDTFEKNGGMAGIIDMESKGEKCFIHGTPPGVLVEWTQEREDFFKRLEEGFRGLSSNLNKFLADLDAEKIDLLISNNSLLKLTQ